MKEVVSILIPVYNAERWVGEAIESALAQTYPHKEVIVVDDGSTDGSLDVIRRYQDRIRFETGPNRGGNPTRNRLLELSTGTWIQYLDADDLLLPDKVAHQMAYATSDVDVLYSPVLMQFDETDGVQKRELLPISEPHDPWRLLALWKLPQTGCPLWRREAVIAVGGWNPTQRICQEHELYLRLLKNGKSFLYAPVEGAVYRQWSTDTVCRRDVPATYRNRLQIMTAAEEYLTEHGLMTPLRRGALDEAYLECSRIIWTFDPVWAREIMARVDQAAGRRFRPQPPLVPAAYSLLYRTVGFDWAERVASWKRNLASR